MKNQISRTLVLGFVLHHNVAFPYYSHVGVHPETSSIMLRLGGRINQHAIGGLDSINDIGNLFHLGRCYDHQEKEHHHVNV
jgi:hypothetical protein